MDNIYTIVRDAVRSSAAVHKRRVAIRQGNVEPVTAGCDHSDWDHVKQWCNGCGITLKEIILDDLEGRVRAVEGQG
jgi:hypothetical protein